MDLSFSLDNRTQIGEIQNNFLNTTLGKVVNVGLDLGLRAILPDFIEEQIIQVKDTILQNGFKQGIDEAINSAIDLGKSAMGIVTGNFENISQIQTAVKSGGIIDTTSKLIDKVINFSEKKELLDSNICKVIKKGKNTILDQISKNIEESLTTQIKSIEKLDKYCKNWKEYFSNQDFEGMEKEYKKIQMQIENIVPIEKIIKETRTIENLHKLIKNNGKNFDLSEEEIELSKRLI